MQQNLLSLDDVKSHFEHWRTTRTKLRERIPQYLWEEVKPLLDRYTLADITKTLRINTSQIKDNLKTLTNINFAEARMDVPGGLFNRSILSSANKNQTCSIELQRANGVLLRINALPIVSLHNIISQFME